VSGNEQLYYSSGSFAFRIDDEGRIIDNINGQCIGICNTKKKEILSDYDTLSRENASLKQELSGIKGLIEKYQEDVPIELAKIVEKPPTIEELQAKITNMQGMMSDMLRMMQSKGGDEEDVHRDGSMSKAGGKQSGGSRSRKAVQPVDGEPE